MKVSKTIKKGVEPAAVVPVLVYLILEVSKQIGVDTTPAGAAAIAGFFYGVYRAFRNFVKNRKK